MGSAPMAAAGYADLARSSVLRGPLPVQVAVLFAQVLIAVTVSAALPASAASRQQTSAILVSRRPCVSRIRAIRPVTPPMASAIPADTATFRHRSGARERVRCSVPVVYPTAPAQGRR